MKIVNVFVVATKNNFILDDHQKSDFDNGIDFFVERSHIQGHPRNHFEFDGRNLVVDTGFKCSRQPDISV